MARRPCGRRLATAEQGPWHMVSDPHDFHYYCSLPRMRGKQRCEWHWLASQPTDVQKRAAEQRLRSRLGVPERPRVPKEEWPEGHRWCAGCQSFVPMFYTTGSRCRSCASTAAHGQRIQRQYDITPEDYERLFRFQGGVCYICRRRPRTKRLAVDHDHRTGEVRGLLCANNENGCNRAVIANLEAAVDGGLAAAKRALAYLEHPPYARMTGQPKREVAQNRSDRTPEQPPPF